MFETAVNVTEVREQNEKLARKREHLDEIKAAEALASQAYNDAQLLIWRLQYERELVENEIAELDP